MRVYGSRHLVFGEDGVLRCGEQQLTAVVPDKAWPGMYRVRWPDGELSADFYNLIRARDHARSVALGILNADYDGEETTRGVSLVSQTDG